MPKLKIDTTQNVGVTYDIANVADRLVAGLLDYLVFVAYYLILLAISPRVFFPGAIFNKMSMEPWQYLMIFLFWVIPYTCYDLFCEHFFNGRSIGKLVMGIRVIKEDGTKPSFGELITRWMFRLVDNWGIFFIVMIFLSSVDDVSARIITGLLYIFPLPLVAIFSIAFSKKEQRFGDMAAGTILVKKNRKIQLEETVLTRYKEDYQPVFLNVLELSDNDIRAIKEAVLLAQKYNNITYAKEVASKVKAFLKYDKKVSAIKLLETVLKDYSYLANKEEEKSNSF